MKNYEIMFILSTQLTDEEKQAGVTLVENTLTKAGAVEVKTEIWGDRKLAYPIKKKENGYYVLTLFQIDRFARRAPAVARWRWLFPSRGLAGKY